MFRDRSQGLHEHKASQVIHATSGINLPGAINVWSGVNFIYVHKKSAAIAAQIFEKLNSAQKHRVKIRRTEFDQNLTVNAAVWL
jgi:hypothetical protein